MASYGWSVEDVNKLPFVTAMALLEQIRKYPPQSVLQVDMLEAAEREQKSADERQREESLKKMGAVKPPSTKRKILSVEVKKTGRRLY